MTLLTSANCEAMSNNATSHENNEIDMSFITCSQDHRI
jgi:hypothetical protein